jgi:hypothetical protein
MKHRATAGSGRLSARPRQTMHRDARRGSPVPLHRYLGNGVVQRLEFSAAPLIQRTCACGGTCADCREENEPVQTKLKIGSPGDRFEQEADRVADAIMRTPNALPAGEQVAALPSIQRLSNEVTGAGQTDVSLPTGGGRPLSPRTRAYMEPRFRADFSHVRVHAGRAAEETAEQLNAHAFTYGREIWLGKGAREGDSQLMAHELTHTLQQGAARTRAGSQTAILTPRIQRRWDRATSECPEQSTDRWIERVVVQQETPQTVTIHWSDGSQESDTCSTGKGHCCVDPANPDGVACTVERSQADGTNCTPITRRNGYLVKHRDLDHNGVLWWTEFVPSRGIALHEYTPVDGTPLSHGCVRLHHAMAVKIFCGVRQNQTWVQVQGFARPMCNHPALQREWINDFDWGGQDLSAQDGDADVRRSILETRRMLNAAFGRTLTVGEIRSLGPADIPRCTAIVQRPTSAAAQQP